MTVPTPEFKAPVAKFAVHGLGNPVDHTIGDEDCAACWSDTYPKRCNDPECRGLIHQEYEDEGEDYIAFHYECDICGDTDRADDPPLVIDQKTWDAIAKEPWS